MNSNTDFISLLHTWISSNEDHKEIIINSIEIYDEFVDQ